MDVRDYPVDVRAEYPQRSSRLWAVLTIFWIKAFALIPHGFILIFLGIAQFFVALAAQFVIAFKGGEYPAGMHGFVTGVLRWQTRVFAFFFSITDRYPPFTLEPRADYPVDVVAVRPEKPSRAYAVWTIVVEILAVVGVIALAIWVVSHVDWFTTTASSSSSNGQFNFRVNFPTSGGSGLLLRQLAAIPHYFVLIFIGFAAFVLWFVVQWVILFVARFPYGMWDIVAGYVRWTTRVSAYALGLTDCYPPFSMSPSVAGAPGGRPLAPPPPMTATWPQAPAGGGAQAPAPQAPPPPQPPAPLAPGPQDQPQMPGVPGPQAPPPPEPPRPEPPQAPPPAG
jgi:hypothetical protein